jgi:hypothetical protein
VTTSVLLPETLAVLEAEARLARMPAGQRLHAREAMSKAFSNDSDAAKWEAEMTRGPFRALLSPSGTVAILDTRRPWNDQGIGRERDKADAKVALEQLFAAFDRGEELEPEFTS